MIDRHSIRHSDVKVLRSHMIDELKRRNNVWQKTAAPYRQAVGLSDRAATD